MQFEKCKVIALIHCMNKDPHNVMGVGVGSAMAHLIALKPNDNSVHTRPYKTSRLDFKAILNQLKASANCREFNLFLN